MIYSYLFIIFTLFGNFILFILVLIINYSLFFVSISYIFLFFYCLYLRLNYSLFSCLLYYLNRLALDVVCIGLFDIELLFFIYLSQRISLVHVVIYGLLFTEFFIASRFKY